LLLAAVAQQRQQLAMVVLGVVALVAFLLGQPLLQQRPIL
jgi:hypothetical protein